MNDQKLIGWTRGRAISAAVRYMKKPHFDIFIRGAFKMRALLKKYLEDIYCDH